jgi:hypothetical protein
MTKSDLHLCANKMTCLEPAREWTYVERVSRYSELLEFLSGACRTIPPAIALRLASFRSGAIALGGLEGATDVRGLLSGYS